MMVDSFMVVLERVYGYRLIYGGCCTVKVLNIVSIFRARDENMNP